MTNQEIDVLVLGSGFGLAAGTWLGYKLRGIREWARRHREEIDEMNARGDRLIHKVKQMPSFGDAMRAEQGDHDAARKFTGQPAFVSLHKHEQRIPKVKLATEWPGREDVLDALTSAGYKKATAVAAVDAVPSDERVTVETWTVAALQKAMRS